MIELLPDLVRGIVLTVQITLAAGLLGLTVSLIVGAIRAAPLPLLRAITGVYVELFRGTSALVQIFFVFYVLPLLGVRIDPFPSAVLTLGLNFGAYGSEIVRSAIVNVDVGQREAAVALNLPSLSSLRRIILPQAAALMVLPFGNLLIELLKGTALVSLVTLHDLAFIAKLQLFATGRALDVYGLTLLVYLAIATPIVLLARYVDIRTKRHLHLRVVQ